MTTLSIQLEEALKKQLESKARELKMNSDDLVVKAIKDFLYLERVNQLRNSLQGKADQSGFRDEQDILDRIS
jgi:predicted transcriptional regulator